MKSLALIPIAGALFLYGSAFFEFWTAPGLESLPTFKSVTEDRSWSFWDEPESPIGIMAVSVAHDYQPAGVILPDGDRPAIALPTPVKMKVRETPPAKKAVAYKDLPPRWYTTNPPFKPKPKRKVYRNTYARSAYSRAGATMTSRSTIRGSRRSARVRNTGRQTVSSSYRR